MAIQVRLSRNDLSMSLLPSPAPPSDVIFRGIYCGLTLIRPIRRVKLAEACMAPYINATACDACRKITTQALISADGYRLHTIAAAKVAAINHCQLCRLIVDQIESDQHSLDLDMIVMRVANTNGTPYCQDELVVVNESEGASEMFITLLGVYTDEGTCVLFSYSS